MTVVPERTHTCSQCKRRFRPTHERQRFCSQPCLLAFMRIPERPRRGRRAQGTTTERGYGTDHQRIRRQWKPIVEAGGVRCWRCNELIHPGTRWDLGHDDHDRSRYRGPEHAACNRRAGGIKGNRSPLRRLPSSPAPPPKVTTLRW